MAEAYPNIGNIKPDADSLINDVILRRGTPARVHIMELFLDREILNEIDHRFDVCGQARITPNTEHYDSRRLMELLRFLGYDWVPARVAGLDLIYNWNSTQDTENGQQARDNRNWMNEHRGPIGSWEDFEKYPWPDLADADISEAQWMARNLPEGMCLGARGGHWCEGLVWLFGYENLCYQLFDDRELIYAVLSKLDEIETVTAQALLSIPEVRFSFPSDDLGFKTGLMISPDDTRELILTGHRKMAALFHQAGKPTVLHACGKRTDILEDLIEDVKIDAIHSFEDTIEKVTESKNIYGHRMSLIGGIDVDFLCRADPAAIRQRVRETLEICHPGGGYAMGSGNSVANYIPLENYLAMIDEAHLWSRK